MLLDAMRQAERREAYREALELQAELVDLLPADDPAGSRCWMRCTTRAEWLIDHRAETNAPVAVKALRAIDGLLEQSSDHARRAIVKFRLANFLAWGTGELDQAHEACLQAHELFGRAGERQQTLLAARELAWITGLRGDLAGMGTRRSRGSRRSRCGRRSVRRDAGPGGRQLQRQLPRSVRGGERRRCGAPKRSPARTTRRTA